MNKFNLSDVAFLIPVRLDSIDRLENLLSSVRFLNNHFFTNIYILVADRVDCGIIDGLLGATCNCIFVKDYDTIFHRTKYINQLVARSEEPILVIWDADIVINPKQIYDAARNIRIKKYEICFPYNGIFYDVLDPIRYLFVESLDLNILENNIGKFPVLYKTIQNGGAIFISRESFYNSGGECEEYYGWGSEDWNRYEKWKRLGYRMNREKGPLFHLHHSRNINGRNSSIIQRRRCRTILNETLYSLPAPPNNYTYPELKINKDSGKWLHPSLNGHTYDSGFADSLIEVFKTQKIKTAVDLGCGPGWYVEDMIQYGISSFGFDGNPNVILQSAIYPCAKGNCIEFDLTVPITNMEKVEGVVCIEVCEHIPSEKESILINNILYFEARLIVMSWAAPGQKGDGHVNCKDQKDVIYLFESHNYELSKDLTSYLRKHSELWWLKENILVFLKK